MVGPEGAPGVAPVVALDSAPMRADAAAISAEVRAAGPAGEGDQRVSLQQRLARLKGMDDGPPQGRAEAVRLLLTERLATAEALQQTPGRGPQSHWLNQWLEDQPTETMEIHL